VNEANTSSTIKLEGQCLHGGQNSTLQFSKKLDGFEPQFYFPGFVKALTSSDLKQFSRSSLRSTILTHHAQTIRTPEHLLAALLFFSDQSVNVFCNTSELPGLDGSALPYREALVNLFPQVGLAPKWKEYPTTLNWSKSWEQGFIEVSEAEHFSVTYTFIRGPIHESFYLDSPAVAWQEILPARTFIFYSDWREGLSRGLMQGAGMNSGLLLAETEFEFKHVLEQYPQLRNRDSEKDGMGSESPTFPLINQPHFRVQQEIVKHKILDLLGDLAILGLALPKLQIKIQNGGHAIHHLLLEKLLRN